ncbi:MAG: adenine deaminase [Desulfarculaceae bacterium]|nr:adenine deaminase [Desulfarculaceae bacterium]MCF8070950.1 adenine deaminase [Desulfarculaceae bacterium]MCF8100538.1 adenine deaminase [Desulfarculaceae bacterium]MCF8116564.1 adenine deaminase [Desulfarculaceae bacterium]
MSKSWTALQQERLAAARGDIPAELVFSGGKVVNVFTGKLEHASVAVHKGVVVGLGDYTGRREIKLEGAYLAPAFIEGHIHVESSLLAPAGLARLMAPHGTTALVGDPHEIGNVMGLPGVEAMLAASRSLPLTFYFTAPSCVPATGMEDSGADLEAKDLVRLARHPRVIGLSEMMNFPGAAGGDPATLAKLHAFRNRPRDGHAPLLGGKMLAAYLTSGPESEHEATLLSEGAEKLARGMWLMIRQGTSAKNLATLLPLVNRVSERRCMLVSDDVEADTLAARGHLDHLLRLAVAQGLDPMTALRLVTLNPARRFGLARRGGIAPGWRADLVVLEDLKEFPVRATWHGGRLVASEGRCLHPCGAAFPDGARQTMRVAPLGEDAFQVRAIGSKVRVIGVTPGQIVTQSLVEDTPQKGGRLAADPGRDLARLAVIERHHASGRVGLGLVKGLGLTQGALASTVAHDSHNLMVVGADDRSMLTAARRLVELGGGWCVARGSKILAELPLPIAGLMSDAPLDSVLGGLAELERAAASVCALPSPFMAVSFLALPVIPHLKISDRGLIDVDAFAPVELFLD